MTDTDLDTDHADLPDDVDEDHLWDHGLLGHLSGPRRHPESVPTHLWPDRDTAACAASLLVAAIAAEPDGPLDQAARRTALTLARRAAPDEVKPGLLARIGLVILAGQTAIATVTSWLDEQGEDVLAADLIELNTLAWFPERSAANLPHRLSLARRLHQCEPAAANLGPIASFAACNDEYVPGALRAMMRAVLHDDQLFHQPFTLLRQALAQSTADDGFEENR